MKINNVFSQEDENFPVYLKYEGQFNPQPCYITLDLRDGRLSADVNGEINATPMSIWNGLVLTWTLDPYTTGSKIQEILEDNKTYFQNVLDNSEVKWDGNNYVVEVESVFIGDPEQFAIHGHDAIADDSVLLDYTDVDFIMTAENSFNDIKDNFIAEIDYDDCLPDPELDIENVLREYYTYDLDESEHTPEIKKFINE